MESYPENFAGVLKRLAEQGRDWTENQGKGDGDAADGIVGNMEGLKAQLVDMEVLDEGACQQLMDMSISAGALALCQRLGWEEDTLEDKEQCFEDACNPQPGEVSDTLWRRTKELFQCGAAIECAELQGNAREAQSMERSYNRHARFVAGFGKVGSGGAGNPADPDDYAQKAAEIIPATVVMFSGCMDEQTSADVYNTSSFGLPSDAGPGGAGGACTSSMIKALNEGTEYSWVSMLARMREILAGEYTQIPMLSSSRNMDMTTPFGVNHPNPSGRHRALLVGINYVGSSCELRGCHNDVETMRRYLLDQGYSDEEMRIQLDDGSHEQPTRANMLAGFAWLVQGAEEGDSLFFHYSGHGASVRDDNGDEADGKDEALCPVDYDSAGLLRDDDAFKELVAPLGKGTWLTCVLDCCHSGTILDLPYLFKADDGSLAAVSDGQVGMQQNNDFDFGKIMQVIKDHPAKCAAAGLVAGVLFFAAGPETKRAMRSSFMNVMQSDDKVSAALGAAGSIMGSFMRGNH